MFAVLTLDCTRRPGALWRRRFQSCVTQRRPAGEGWYYLIHHYCPAGRPDWKQLCRVLGREKHHLIFPTDLTPPPDVGIRRYDSSAFCAQILTRMFCRVLRDQPRPVGPAVLIDRDGVLQNTAERLLPLTPQLIISTQNSAKYLDFIRRAELLYGVSPILGESERSLQSAVAVLAPHGVGGVRLPDRAVLLGRKEDGGYYLEDGCLSLSPEVRDLVPQGISPLEMLAALHEKCELRLPVGKICPVLCKGGGKSSVSGLVFTISCLT